MFARWSFYFTYAARNLARSARWTLFAVFCIGAGVATVVALRSLGLAIGDTLIANARFVNHGDITISLGSTFNLGGDENEEGFTPQQIDLAQGWARENNAQVTAYKRTSNLQVTALDGTTVGRPQFVTVIFVDPATFSPAGPVTALEPLGAALDSLMPGAREIVISSNLARDQGIALGDTVRLSNTTDTFLVTGIVSAELEASLENPLASFFGFAYVHLNQLEPLQLNSEPNVLSFGLPETITPDSAEAALRRLGIAGQTRTLPDLLESYATISDLLGRFIVVMGLGALLIGGVGIINTMLALVARRTTEIAALKTFGLNGRQVMLMFLTEALFLGILGSLAGVAAGVLLSGFVNQFGEQFLQQRLVWRIYPEAVLFGLALGIVVTLVFGILPVLTANRVRPATILRPNEARLPAVGAFHSILALLLIVLVIGTVAGQILGAVWVGVVGVSITLVLLGFLTFLLWLLVWVISRLPSFGIVDVQLALRNMRARRVRTATTLLALSAGMFALSSITFVGIGTREILNVQVSQSFGGNVLAFPALSVVSPAIAEALLNARVATLDGIEYQTKLVTQPSVIVSIDGQPFEPAFEFEVPDEAPQRAQREADRVFSSITLQSRDSTNPNLTSGRLLAGRDLTAEDRGRPVMVVAQGGAFGIENTSGLVVGSMVEVDYVDNRGGINPTLEVVGLVEATGGFSFGQAYVPPGVLPDGFTSFQIYQVSADKLNETLLALSEIPFVLTLDLNFIDGLLNRFISQFSAIPTVVGVLSLLTAAVAMANTVSLATLERRRQIGILKAVGAGTGRVLGVMLIENTLIGLLGGVLGIGLSALGVALLTLFSIGDAIPIPRDAVPTAIALIVAAVVIAVGATLLSAQVAVREKVIDVLRYE